MYPRVLPVGGIDQLTHADDEQDVDIQIDQLTALGVARDRQVKASKWAGFGLPRLSV